jgi:hypothetical protein
MQEELLSLTTVRPGNYIMRVVLELAPNMSLNKFCAAWEDIVRATILRTGIVQHNDLGFLQVAVKEGIQWVQAEKFEDHLQGHGLIAMELGQPLSRYTIVGEGIGNKRWFIWTIHYVLYDSWFLFRVTNVVNGVCRGYPLKEQREFKTFVKYVLG